MAKNDVKKEQGLRVKKLRAMSELSRKQLADKLGVSQTTVQNWEDGFSSGLSEKGATNLVEFLNRNGIECSLQWLLSGNGSLPAFGKKNYCQDSLSINSEILKEVSFFESHNPFSTTYQINDNSMEPCYRYGDIVGGIKIFGEDIYALSGKACIVETKVGKKSFKILEYNFKKKTFHLLNTTPQDEQIIFQNNVEILSAAPVIWMRRTLLD